MAERLASASPAFLRDTEKSIYGHLLIYINIIYIYTQKESGRGVLRRTLPVIIVVIVIITFGKKCGVYENQRNRRKNRKKWRRERLRVPGHR